MDADSIKDIWNSLEREDRLKFGYAIIAILAVAIVWSIFSGKISMLEKKRVAREAVLKEIMPLASAYKTAKMTADQLTAKMGGIKGDDSPAKIIEEIGIKGKGVRVVPVKGEDRAGFAEDAADIKIDGLSSNEVVNLLYRVEKGSRAIIVKKASVRTRFDDPSKVDLTMTLALLKPLPTGQKAQ